MLLDRKRIRKWAKWVALFLAIVFGASFLFLGVGYGGGAGFNISEIFSGCGTATTEPVTQEDMLGSYLQALEADPNDTTAMLAIATIYEGKYRAGEGEGNEHLVTAAAFLEYAIDVDPSLTDVYIRLANIYMSEDIDNSEAAVKVLNKATSADPDNADVYLKLGIAQQNLGNKQAAILAWQKYLELDPDGDMAEVVREQLVKLTETTTTTAPTTTTDTEAESTTTTTGQ